MGLMDAFKSPDFGLGLMGFGSALSNTRGGQGFDMTPMALLLMQRKKERDQQEKMKGLMAQMDLNPQQRAYMEAAGPRGMEALGGMVFPQAAEQPSDVREYQYYVQQAEAAGQKPMSYMEYQTALRKAGGTNVTSITNLATPGDAFANLPQDVRKVLFEQHGLARDAVDLIAISNEGLKLLDQGMITGAGAGIRRDVLKWAHTLGVDVPQDAVNNTEAYKAVMGNAVAKVIKQFGAGSGLSDADRAYAERIAAGDIELNEGSMRKILGIAQKLGGTRVEEFTQMRDKVLIDKDMSAILGINMPELYQPPSPPQPSSPPPSASAGAGSAEIPPAPPGVDPELWRLMTDEDRALWLN